MRDQVEMPGEPKYKKFEDWQKKGTVYYNSFKGAKRTIPEGAAPIIMPPSGKKDEYEVIVPEHTLFEWNSGSQLTLDPLKVIQYIAKRVHLLICNQDVVNTYKQSAEMYLIRTGQQISTSDGNGFVERLPSHISRNDWPVFNTSF